MMLIRQTVNQLFPGSNSADNKTDVIQEVTDVGTMSIHVGANQDQVIILDIPEITAYTLGTDTINVMTGYTARSLQYQQLMKL